MLLNLELPPQVRVLSQNRVYPYGTNDAVVLSHPAYLGALPRDIDPETVYIPRAWPEDLPYNRVDSRAQSTHMALALLAGWQQTRVCAVGWDGVCMGEPTASMPYPAERGIKGPNQGYLQGSDRWRQASIEAQALYGMVVLQIVSPRELANWVRSLL